MPDFKIKSTQKVKGKSDGIITLPHKISPETALLAQISGFFSIKNPKQIIPKTPIAEIIFFIAPPKNYFIYNNILILQGSGVWWLKN